MPITIAYQNDLYQGNDISLEVFSAWFDPANLDLPPCTSIQLWMFIASSNVLYGTAGQERFVLDFTRFLEVSAFPEESFWGISDNWGRKRRGPLRTHNELLAASFGSLDCGQTAKLRRKGISDAIDLKAMSEYAPSEVIANLIESMLQSEQIFLLGEKHGANKHDNVELLRAICGIAAEERIIRVLLDGIPCEDDNGRLTHERVLKNYADVEDKLFKRCEWYGIEPPETEMFTVCANLNRIERTREVIRASVLELIDGVKNDEEFRLILADVVNKKEFIDDVAEIEEYFTSGDGSESADEIHLSADVPVLMAVKIKAIASQVEWANNAQIRMDANIAWGRTIAAVSQLPLERRGDANVKKRKPRLTIVVLCGMNHLLMRSSGSIPVQATLPVDSCFTLCLVDDGPSRLCRRTVDDSANYVTTMPKSWIIEYNK